MTAAIRPGVSVCAGHGAAPWETYGRRRRQPKLGIRIEWHFPDRAAVEGWKTKGLYSFRESLGNRHESAGSGKWSAGPRFVRPARRVTGQSREQGLTRRMRSSKSTMRTAASSS